MQFPTHGQWWSKLQHRTVSTLEYPLPLSTHGQWWSKLQHRTRSCAGLSHCKQREPGRTRGVLRGALKEDLRGTRGTQAVLKGCSDEGAHRSTQLLQMEQCEQRGGR